LLEYLNSFVISITIITAITVKTTIVIFVSILQFYFTDIAITISTIITIKSHFIFISEYYSLVKYSTRASTKAIIEAFIMVSVM
jgi:hypothetical protein